MPVRFPIAKGIALPGLFLSVLFFLIPGTSGAEGLELEGSVALELRVFPGPRSYPGQDKSLLSPSIALAPKFFYETNSGVDRFTFKPYYRADADDPERTHADVLGENAGAIIPH